MNTQQMITRAPLYLLAWCTLAVTPTFAQTFTHVPLFTFDGDSLGDQFGSSVSGAGDVDGDGFADVIVGAVLDDNNGESSGSARVFSGVDGSVVYNLNGDSANDFFGNSVSGAGDVNGDGFDDLIVGAPGIFFNDGANRGGARVLSGSDGSALFSFFGDSANDFFGISVSGAGDVNGDGIADLVVGAAGDDRSGSTRVLSGSDGSVLLAFDGNSISDSFGEAVSGAGDVNGDGFDDLIVGGLDNDPNSPVSGTVRVISGSDGGTLYTFDGDSVGDFFGDSVSGAGDVNNDGFDDLIVGARGDDNNGSASGSARIFSGVDGSVLYIFNGDSVNDSFGISVSGAGDVNGDGFADLIVGVAGDDDNGINSGSARVFSGSDGSVLYTFSGDSVDDLFGISVGGAGDVNGDGLADFIVGARNGGANNGGYARLFVSHAQESIILVDYTISTTAQEFFAFEGLGTLSDNGYQITLPPTNGSNFGLVNDTLITEGVFIDENSQFLVEATVGEFNDGDFVLAIREDSRSGEFFTITVPAADLADDGRSIVNMRDFFFVGDATDGIPNGTISSPDLQSPFDSGRAVDITIQRITAINTTALMILGDADENRIVDFADIPRFIEILIDGSFLEQVDINRDDDVNFLDIPLFIEILVGQ